MNGKKRPRLDIGCTTITMASQMSISDAIIANSSHATTTTSSSTTSGNGGSTNGIFLHDVNAGAQIFLTICDDDDTSNESQEYYAIESTAAHIKQEPDIDLHALLPTNLQLPTGCEIYLVKDTSKSSNVGNEQLLPLPLPLPLPAQQTHSMASIKVEPDSRPTPSTTNVLLVGGGSVSGITTNGGCGGGAAAAISNSAVSSTSRQVTNLSHATTTVAAAAANITTTTTSTTITNNNHININNNNNNGYNNVKMDAYKKRDDKRRATHNEVERRRRDKINCWIFKLKEMLPTDGNRYRSNNTTITTTTTTGTSAPTTTSTPTTIITTTNAIHNCSDSVIEKSTISNNNTKTTIKCSQVNGRTPPNDSKSQILIKACDYIKSMQHEIDGLRECLREADDLRLSNQALREELERLKHQQELQERFHNAATGGNGGSFNVTLNSLNSSATTDLFEGIDSSSNLGAVTSMSFTKRGLMISDYDE